ncbi:MAG: hypothetical protein GY751_03845 [Bacteroidetes bacterium]|nr:hypothetical protein [Bacteroidota bacterium]
MGVSIAKSAVNQIQQEGVDVANEFFTLCTNIQSNTNVFQFGDGCKADIQGKIFIKNQASISTSCLQSQSVSTSIQQEMRSRILQKTNAVVQNLGIGASVSNSLTNLSQQLADNISTSVTQRCITQGNNINRFECKNNADVKIGPDAVIQVENNTNLGQTCVSETTANNQILQDMVNQISQSSVATTANNFAVLAIFFGLIIFALFYFTYKEINSPVGTLIIFIIIGLVIGSVAYTYFARQNNFYPFARESN